MNDDASRTSGASRERSSVDGITGDVYENAIAEVVRLILELTSTNQTLSYADAARIRVELENALREAQHTFEAMPDGPARVAALRRLDGLCITAERQLKMAPPGEPNASPRDVEEWKARRLGHGASAPRPARRRHSDAPPEAPGAMPIESSGTERELSHATPVPVVPADPGPEKEHR